MKKICDQCLREYFEDDDAISPADELGRIFLKRIEDTRSTKNICPECREKLGILFLLGFGE